MAHYKVQTSEGTVEFDADRADLTIEDVKGVVAQLHPASEEHNPVLAKMASSIVTPGQSQDVSFLGAMKETLLPPTSIDSAKRLLNPNAGQFGISRYLEQKGQQVGAAVRGSVAGLPGVPRAIVGAVSDSLTPSAQQQQVGGEAVGTALGPVMRGIGRGASKVGELFSGVPAQTLQRVAKDPAVILPEVVGGPPSRKVAGAALGEAEKAAGMISDTPTSPFKADASIADEYFTRVRKGETLTPPELLEAYQTTSRTITKTPRKDARYVAMVNFEKSLKKQLNELSKDYAKASATFARAATGDTATNFIPRTATGKVSIGRLGFGSLVLGGGILNPALPLTLAAGAPITSGIVAAGAGAAAKVLGKPGVRGAGLSALLARQKQRKSK